MYHENIDWQSKNSANLQSIYWNVNYRSSCYNRNKITREVKYFMNEHKLFKYFSFSDRQVAPKNKLELSQSLQPILFASRIRHDQAIYSYKSARLQCGQPRVFTQDCHKFGLVPVHVEYNIFRDFLMIWQQCSPLIVTHFSSQLRGSNARSKAAVNNLGEII